jgi:ATP-binding protein involved in chromosome partitioning
MTDTLQARLAEALAPIANPRTGASLYATQQVRDIATTTDGKVRRDPPARRAPTIRPISRVEVRDAVAGVDGVTEVRVDVKDPAQYERTPPPPPLRQSRLARSP